MSTILKYRENLEKQLAFLEETQQNLGSGEPEQKINCALAIIKIIVLLDT